MIGAASTSTKRYRLGTHRTRTPEETWTRVAEHLPRVGITRVADLTALDVLGIPVFQAVRPGSWNLAVSQGKGATPPAARVGAVMEAIETWHAERLDGLPQTVLSLREMRSANPIPLSALRWQPGVRPLDAAPLAWIRVEPLRGGAPGWLPRQMIELEFRLPEVFEPVLFEKTSNGLASGNCREEALLHALCELVERHGLTRWLRAPASRVALDPESVEAEPGREMIARCRARAMKLALWDATWEAGLPIVVAELAAPDLPHVWRGSGCHPAPDVALSRALSEAAQSRLTYISGARDDLLYPEAREDGMGEDPPGRTFERFEEPTGGKPFAAMPDLATSRVGDDLGRVEERLERCGTMPYAVDLTRPEIGIPVVVAFAPGLDDPPEA
jgi:ribosomal protein S12 methylthiotransferase accessory factor